MSQDELVDVVDENGKVLNVVTKREAHQKGLLHKIVISEIIDSQGRWLMVRPASGKQDSGQYVSPMGGHVTSGETDEDALKREVGEEVGLHEDFKYEYVGRAIFNRNILGRQENHLFVVYKIYSDAKPVLNHESESSKYFTEQELSMELREHPEQFGDAFLFLVKTFFPHLQ